MKTFANVLSVFGPRIIKTGLGVTLAIMICRLFGIQPDTFAAITVVLNMQPSLNKALKNAWEQISIQFIAVPLAFVLGYTFGTSPWTIGLSVILLISLANRLRMEAISLGIVSILFVMDAPAEQFLHQAAIRSLTIFIGLVIALTINRFLAPPRYKEMFKENLYALFEDASEFFFQSIKHFVDSTTWVSYEKPDPSQLEVRLEKTMGLFEHARDELGAADKVLVLERLLELTRGFIERGQTIEEMTRQRVNRRQQPDSPLQIGEIAPEFQEILDLLRIGKDRLGALKTLVQNGLTLTRHDVPEELDYDYWSQFDKAMDQWQRTVSGVFYLRAMMEVAVVATEIRWASKRLQSVHSLNKGR